VKIEEHLRLTESALRNWLIAQCEDSLTIGAMWHIGLRALGVPMAPLWAGLAAVLQFVLNWGRHWVWRGVREAEGAAYNPGVEKGAETCHEN
jgi:predicted PurR-regulated permease PerM